MERNRKNRMILTADMLTFKNGICYVDLGNMSTSNARKVMKEIKVGEFGLQMFIAKMDFEEVEEIQ